MSRLRAISTLAHHIWMAALLLLPRTTKAETILPFQLLFLVILSPADGSSTEAWHEESIGGSAIHRGDPATPARPHSHARGYGCADAADHGPPPPPRPPSSPAS